RKQLGERDAERELIVAGLRNVARDREDAGTSRALHAKVGEPLPALAQDRRDRCDALRVVDRGRRSIEAEVRGEGRLEARLALLTLERLEQRGFLAADIRTGADEGVNVAVDTGALDVLAEQTR